MEVITALDAFSALSNETRLWVFRLLVQAGPAGMSAGEIADHLSVRQNTMSSHLRLLHQSGMINSRRDGRSVIYSADYGTVRELIEFLMNDCCAGNRACRPVAQTRVEAVTGR